MGCGLRVCYGLTAETNTPQHPPELTCPFLTRNHLSARKTAAVKMLSGDIQRDDQGRTRRGIRRGPKSTSEPSNLPRVPASYFRSQFAVLAEVRFYAGEPRFGEFVRRDNETCGAVPQFSCDGRDL